VTHGTFWENIHDAPERGGGILSAGTATLRNSIVAGSGFSMACSEEGITDGGYNISDDDSCAFDQSTSSNSTDPGLASTLANNGEPTKTIALLRGSPAFNAIPQGQSRCATATGRIATDQRGVRRPQGPACDVGAYERARSLPSTKGRAGVHRGSGPFYIFTYTPRLRRASRRAASVIARAPLTRTKRFR
jgi:hypothetical protein